MVLPRELTSILLAVGFSPLFFLLHVFLFRRRSETSPGFAQLLPAAGVYGLAWLLGLGVIRAGAFTATEIVAGGSTAGFIVLAYMQVFSLTCRGFSLRVLVEIERWQGLDLDGIVREYSDGRGLDWLMEKRLAAIEKVGLIERRDGCVHVMRPWGVLAGQMGLVTKRLLRLGQGG
jgi:hypothetical protein